MKRLPKWLAVEEMMQPGRLTRDGMLGDDPRPVEAIIEADQDTVDRLGLTHTDVARRLRELTERSRERLGDPVIVDDVLEVRIEETRGALPCPFKHAGRFGKMAVICTHLPTGESLMWSDLGMHMIEAHGFYEGKGSPFRVDPAQAVHLLGITASREE